jgi:hypothetical protein
MRRDPVARAARIPKLETAGQDQVERRAGDDAHPPGRGNRARESPTGDAHAHTALDDLGPIVCKHAANLYVRGR